MIKYVKSNFKRGWLWAKIDSTNIKDLVNHVLKLNIIHQGFDTETNGLEIREYGSTSFLNAYGIVYTDKENNIHKEVYTFLTSDVQIDFVAKLLNHGKYLWAYNAKFDLNIMLNTYGNDFESKTNNFSNWYDVISLWRLTHNVDESTLNLELKRVAAGELKLDAKQMQDEVKKLLSTQVSAWNKKFIAYAKSNNIDITTDIVNKMKKGDIFVDDDYYNLFLNYIQDNPFPNYKTVWDENKEVVEEYASWDVAMMLDLVLKLWPEINKREQLHILELEHKVLRAIANQERNGLAIDIKYLYQAKKRVIEYYNYIDNKIKELIDICHQSPAIDNKDKDDYEKTVNLFLTKKANKEIITRDKMKIKVDNFLEKWNLDQDTFIKNGRFNINSTDQMTIFMWLAFGLSSKKGWDKVSFRETIENLEKLNFDQQELIDARDKAVEFMQLILLYRRLSKWANTYIGRFIVDYQANNTGRIYPSFSPYKVVTGRMSSPFQQQPKDNLIDIRTNEPLFSPRKMVKCDIDANGVLVYDLSQIEIRVNAHYTHLIGHPDKVLDEVLFNGGDMHTITAAHAFHYYEFMNNKENALKLVTKNERNNAKNLNFAMQYGGSTNAIRTHPELGKLPISIQDNLLEAFKATRAGTIAYQKWAMAQLKTTFLKIDNKMLNYVENMYGRRYFATPEWTNSESYKVINYLIQGTCADALKSSLVKIYEYLRKNNLKSKIILNIHDEVQLEIYNNEWYIADDIKKIMEDVDFETTIPIICDVEYYTTTWDEKEVLEWEYGE